MAKSQSKKTVTIKGICNESQLEHVTYNAEKAKCEVEMFDCSTKAKVTGSVEQIEKFIKLYNA